MAYHESDIADITLRFPLGAEVECNVGTWAAGTVVQHWYRQRDWPPGRFAAYQVKLNNGNLIYAPMDDDRLIRQVREMKIHKAIREGDNDGFVTACEKAKKAGAGLRQLRDGPRNISEDEALIEAINEYDGQGDTPLYIAIELGRTELAHRCLASGADPNLISERTLSYPIHVAVEKGDGAMVDALLRHGGDVNAQTCSQSAYAQNEWVRRKEDEHGVLQKERMPTLNNTPLMVAVREGYTDIVKQLIEQGANLELKDEVYDTALLIALEEEQYEVAEILLDHGASATVQKEGSLGTPLHSFVSSGDADAVRLLLKALTPEDINSKASRGGFTPLGLAARRGSVEICRALMEKGADPQLPDGMGHTPLHYATVNKKQQVMDMLR
mmetsp:Transcript_3653/g.13118  ORF Transcript_3653/g.13118 Transcript_3653/m.13118 type:complete len:384 (-) Transcript_3653:235-1386(-)